MKNKTLIVQLFVTLLAPFCVAHASEMNSQQIFNSSAALKPTSTQIIPMNICHAPKPIDGLVGPFFLPNRDDLVLIPFGNQLYSLKLKSNECVPVLTLNSTASFKGSYKIVGNFLIFDWWDRANKNWGTTQALNFNDNTIHSVNLGIGENTVIDSAASFIIYKRQPNGFAAIPNDCLIECADSREKVMHVMPDLYKSAQEQIDMNPDLLDSNLPVGNWRIAKTIGDKVYVFSKAIYGDIDYPDSLYEIDLTKYSWSLFGSGKFRTDGSVKRIWKSNVQMPDIPNRYFFDMGRNPFGQILIVAYNDLTSTYLGFDLNTQSTVAFSYGLPEARVPLSVGTRSPGTIYERPMVQSGTFLGVFAPNGVGPDYESTGQSGGIVVLDRANGIVLKSEPGSVFKNLNSHYFGMIEGKFLTGAVSDNNIVLTRWQRADKN